MSGRPQKFALHLSIEDREYLEQIASSRTAQVRHQQRAKILLQRAAGASYAEIKEAVGVSTPTIAKVVKKAYAYGARAALDDLKRTGRPDRIPREAKVWIVSLTCQLPESVPGATKTQGLSLFSVGATVVKRAHRNMVASRTLSKRVACTSPAPTGQELKTFNGGDPRP